MHKIIKSLYIHKIIKTVYIHKMTNSSTVCVFLMARQVPLISIRVVQHTHISWNKIININKNFSENVLRSKWIGRWTTTSLLHNLNFDVQKWWLDFRQYPVIICRLGTTLWIQKYKMLKVHIGRRLEHHIVQTYNWTTQQALYPQYLVIALHFGHRK